MQPEVETTNPYEDAEHMRILVCRTCGSIDEMPDWVHGPDSDPFLPAIISSRHAVSHEGQLYRLPVGLWLLEDKRQEIVQKVSGGPVSSGLAIIDPKFYDVRNTFMEDAMKCYELHLRPKGQCPDYMSDRKDLLPDTKADRREAGLPDRPTGPRSSLCQYCPVHSFNRSKKFHG